MWSMLHASVTDIKNGRRGLLMRRYAYRTFVQKTKCRNRHQDFVMLRNTFFVFYKMLFFICETCTNQNQNERSDVFVDTPDCITMSSIYLILCMPLFVTAILIYAAIILGNLLSSPLFSFLPHLLAKLSAYAPETCGAWEK